MNMLSAIYGYAVARRNRRYDEHTAEIIRVEVPVVSVGNISVGGTGKTPFVQYVVRELLALGHRPAVVSRGYGRKSRGEVIVSDGTSILASVAQSGDELMLHAERLPVPVIANADRVAGAQTARRLFGVDAIVLDDGFQHRRLFRDCDIALVDRPTLQRPVLLPAGRLREPVESLRRAHIVCCTGGVACSDLPGGCLAAGALCIEAAMEAGDIIDAFTREPLQLSGVAVAVAGIARPERFFTSLASHVSVAECLAYADHRDYRNGDVLRMLRVCAARRCTAVVTTEKDAVKLRGFRTEFNAAGVRLAVLTAGMKLTRGAEALRHRLSLLFESEKQ